MYTKSIRFPGPDRELQMKENVEFRVPEKEASRCLPDSLGEKLGSSGAPSVRRIGLDIHDPMVREIGRIDGEYRGRGRAFFTSWRIRRRYTRRELDAAEFMRIWPKKVFEPSGEECGTEYDESRACPVCGAGAEQASPLHLDARRIPKRADFSQTIAGEIVVSCRVADLVDRERLVGAEFKPIVEVNRKREVSSQFMQLVVRPPYVAIDAKTRVGESLYDEARVGSCPRGDTVGLNLISELIVKRDSLNGADFMMTRETVGSRSGLLRPERILVISTTAWRVLRKEDVRGLEWDICRVSERD